MTIYEEIKIFRPKLGRPCRCMKIQGHGYESVVDCVFMFFKFFPNERAKVQMEPPLRKLFVLGHKVHHT